MTGVSVIRGRRTIVRNVCWTVPRGRHWAMVGANGSGKTTLLRTACGYLWPSRGTVELLGHAFGHVDLRELRKRVGWVSSAVHEMIPAKLSAVEVVLSGVYASLGLYETPSPGQCDRARDRLEAMEVRAMADQAFGLLSLGEQQKVLIARALMARPELLVLDEPCAGLDLRWRESLLETVGALAGQPDGPTIVFVTHHIEEIAPVFADALALKAGRVLAAGPTGTVLTDAVLSEAFGLPVVVERTGRRYRATVDTPGRSA